MIYGADLMLLPGTQVGNYTVVEKIGSGGFASVYKVEKDGKFYAMKVLSLNNTFSEADMLCEVRGHQNFPTIYESGFTDDFQYHILELLGPSLAAARKSFGKKKTFSDATLLKIAKDSLSCLEILHKMSILHCDIKPSNFLVKDVNIANCVNNNSNIGGNRDNEISNDICLVDFGLAKKVENVKVSSRKNKDNFLARLKQKNIKGILAKLKIQKENKLAQKYNLLAQKITRKALYDSPAEEPLNSNIRGNTKNLNGNETSSPKSFCGTYRYASLNAMDGGNLTFRDDLLSWFYTIVELAGGLPWASAHGMEETRRAKAETCSQELCKGLPHQFFEIYEYIENLDESDFPDFQWINGQIDVAMNEKGFYGNNMIRSINWAAAPLRNEFNSTSTSGIVEMGTSEECRVR